MSWNKNTFSYILWFVYVVLVGVGVLSVSATVCYLKEYPTEYGIGVTAVYLALSGALVFLVRRLDLKRRLTEQMNPMLFPVVEAAFVVLMLAVGFYLRITGIGLFTGTEDNVYFQAAMVDGQDVPMVVHGATYLYLNLLRICFIVLGNKLLAGVALQIALQMLAAVLFYLAVRKLSGVLSGMVMIAFYMLSPFMVESTLTLSPAIFLFLLFSVALLLVAHCLNKTQGSPFWYLAAGVLSGIVCYLDVFGFVLMVFLLSIIFVEREQEDDILNSKAAVLLYGLSGALISFFGTMIVDALSSGKKLFNVLRAWCTIYQYQDGEIPFVAAQSAGQLLDIILLMGLLAWGIFSFWCSKRQEKQCVWIVATGVLMAMQTHQMMIQNVGSSAYVYLFMAVLAGVALENIFVTEDGIPINEEVFEVLDRMEAAREMPDEAVQKKAPVKKEAESLQPEPEKRRINYIENPLPLPKKHVPKVMDYRFQNVNDKSEYDLLVSDDDDFDI